jgi:hypothetical protein
VWDQLGAANSASDDERLCDVEAHFKIEDFAGKTHHKFAVVDVEGKWNISQHCENEDEIQVLYLEWKRKP